MKRPEILAPAGNLEKLKMSVEYGADAVYFAGSQLGLRAGAQNFSKDDLKEAIDYCHQHGVKAYITVNIIAHDKHFEGIEEYIQYLESIHVDAIIVSDPGVLLKVKEHAPNAEIHLSTQANTTNYQTANFWHEIGADRIVLARELTLEEIKSVIQHKKDTLKIESFVHGAMCISYSGRCLLSSFMTNRHSNLGDCSHPCRWNYSVVEEKRPNEYYPVIEDENGVWQLAARAEKAVMTDGFGRAGDDCAEAAGDIVIAADTAVAAGETVSFKYTYYGGMGPHGPVSARTWALVK